MNNTTNHKKVGHFEDGIMKTILVKQTNMSYIFPRYIKGQCIDVNLKPGIYSVESNFHLGLVLSKIAKGDPKLFRETSFQHYYDFN